MSTYKDLGIKPFINAFDTITTMGGSLMPPEVVAAMAEAAGHFVDLFELNEKVGARIAELTRNEGACVTAGAACGLLLCAAAVMTGCDRALIDRLPDTTGMKNEILVHRCQRLGWQRPPRLSGARLVEFGGEEGTRREDLLSAFTERTAAVLYFASPLFERHALPLPEVISLAHERGVPVIVDAAANLPPASNLWAYTGMGADLAIFSGGKGLRGPQSSGLIVGKKALTDACRMNANPGGGVGRVAKVGKEEIMGLLAAVERFMSMDHDAELARREQWVARAVERLVDAGISARRVFPGIHGQTYPRVRVTLPSRARRDETLNALKAGEPSIVAGSYPDDPESIYLNPLTLQEGEMDIIVDRLLALLAQ